MKVVALLVAAIATGLGACSVERTPPSSVEVRTTYSDASKRLLVECRRTTTGTCHVRLDNAGVVRNLTLQAGATLSVDNFEGAARYCGSALKVVEAACSWSSVGAGAKA